MHLFILWITLAPTQGPVTVTCNTVNSTSITIQWERVQCNERNGQIQGYNVFYYQADDDASEMISVNVSGVSESERMFTANGLLPLTSYTFEVRAFNMKGTGLATNKNFQTTIANGKIS